MKALKILFILMISICVSFTLIACSVDDLGELAEDLLGSKDNNGSENDGDKPNPESCTHADENRDRICDKCAAIYVAPCTAHTDENSDLMCDYCAERLTPSQGDDDLVPDDNTSTKPPIDADDGTATQPPLDTEDEKDEFGGEMTSPECEHSDKNLDYFCDKCGENICDHHDIEGDLICDGCGITLGESMPNETPPTELLPDINNGVQIAPDDGAHDAPSIDDSMINDNDHMHFDEDGNGFCDKCEPTVDEDLLVMDGVRLAETDFIYTGVSITLEFVNLPEDGCSLYMEPEVMWDVGVYNVKVRLTHPRYEDYVFEEVITIHKATPDMSNVHFEGAYVDYDGGEKSLMIGDALPFGVIDVYYEGNDQTESGVHVVTAHFVVDEKRFNTPEPMTAILEIGPHYVVEFDTGDSGIELAPQKVGTVNGYVFPEYIEEDAYYGYRFVEWQYNGKTYNIGEKPVTEDMTLTAVWEKREFAIIYITDGGTAPEANPTSYSIDNIGTVFEDSTQENFVFDGWYYDEDFTERAHTIENIDRGAFLLYAKWIPAE